MYALLLLAVVIGGPEAIQPIFVRTGPAPEETRKFLDALEDLVQRNWNSLPGVRGFVLEAGSELNESRQAVFYARLTAPKPNKETVDFPSIPIRGATTPEEAARDVWQNVLLALRAKKHCGTFHLCPAACTLSYSRDGPPPRFFYRLLFLFIERLINFLIKFI